MTEPVQTSALELQGLFTCPRFGPLTHRACLRRQLERQESTKKGVAGPPMREHCAGGRCETGNTIRAGLAHVAARTCSACGTALIGLEPKEPCPTCAARAREAGTNGHHVTALPCPGCGSVSKHAAGCQRPARERSVTSALRGNHVSTPRAPLSTHVWDKDRADPPLVPPGAPSLAAGVSRPPAISHARPLRAEATESGPVQPEPEDRPMADPKLCPCGRKIRATPDGKRHEKCSGCRGTSPKLKPRSGAKPESRVVEAKPAAATVQRPPAKLTATPAAKPDPEQLVAPSGPLCNLGVDDLVALRNAVTSELKARKEQAESTAAKLREVLEAA